MGNITDTQSLRYGYVSDVITHTMVRDLADDTATQLDLADTARTAALKMPVVWGERITSLSVPVSTITAIPMDTEIEDTHGMLDIGTQPTRVTVTTAAGVGTYVIQVEVQSIYTAWTRGDLLVYKNGVFYAQKTWYQPQDFDNLQLTARVPLGTVGDYLQGLIYHEGGGATLTTLCDIRVYKETG